MGRAQQRSGISRVPREGDSHRVKGSRKDAVRGLELNSSWGSLRANTQSIDSASSPCGIAWNVLEYLLCSLGSC